MARSGATLPRRGARNCQGSTATLPLLLNRMRLLAVEGDAYRDASQARRELDPRRPVDEGVLDQLVLDDLGIGSGEIEAHAAVLRLHARRELAYLAQIDRIAGLDSKVSCTIVPTRQVNSATSPVSSCFLSLVVLSPALEAGLRQGRGTAGSAKDGAFSSRAGRRLSCSSDCRLKQRQSARRRSDSRLR
jgi:hypothetical protein